MVSDFSHIDSETHQPAMVDVGNKAITNRVAVAQSIVVLGKAILSHLQENDIHTKKGPVFQTAIIAGTMAVKKTADLIPLCHPLPLDGIKINVEVISEKEVAIQCRVAVTAKTGVEMEALTGASIAALTIYDMCKALSHDIVIKETRLLSKTGGKSDYQSK